MCACTICTVHYVYINYVVCVCAPMHVHMLMQWLDVLCIVCTCTENILPGRMCVQWMCTVCKDALYIYCELKRCLYVYMQWLYMPHTVCVCVCRMHMAGCLPGLATSAGSPDRVSHEIRARSQSLACAWPRASLGQVRRVSQITEGRMALLTPAFRAGFHSEQVMHSITLNFNPLCLGVSAIFVRPSSRRRQEQAVLGLTASHPHPPSSSDLSTGGIIYHIRGASGCSLSRLHKGKRILTMRES